MKPLRSILTAGLALAMFSTTALRAETFPIFEDAAGSPVTNTIAKSAGAAKTLAVSAKSAAYINFSVGSSSIDPDTVTQARLVIFVPKSSISGTLSIKNLTSGFTETILTKTAPAPTLGATLDTINLALIPLKGDYFISDITTQVRAWLADPNNEFGIAITSDGLASATLASKEGAGSGHPAFIEVDVNRDGGAVAGTTATFTGAVTGAGFTGTSFNGTAFTGSGAALTDLDASKITSGTLADARLSANIPRLTSGLLDDSTHSANIPKLNAATNTFTGTVSGTFSGSGASLTALNGSAITTGTVADGRLSSNVPLKSGANTFSGTQTAPAFVGNGTIPIGGIIIWSGSAINIPAGWLACDGLNGTPDLRGRFVQGHGIGRSVGTVGGSETKTLSINELPPHSFSVSASVATAGYSANYNSSAEVVRAPNNGSLNNGTQTLFGSTNTVGSGQSYSQMNPYYVLCYIQRVQ